MKDTPFFPQLSFTKHALSKTKIYVCFSIDIFTFILNVL